MTPLNRWGGFRLSQKVMPIKVHSSASAKGSGAMRPAVLQNAKKATADYKAIKVKPSVPFKPSSKNRSNISKQTTSGQSAPKHFTSTKSTARPMRPNTRHSVTAKATAKKSSVSKSAPKSAPSPKNARTATGSRHVTSGGVPKRPKSS